VLNLFILAGLTVPGLVLIYFLLRREIRRSFSSNELLRQVESEVESVITELNRTTERNITLIEDKIRHLSQLVKKADHRITLMQKEIEHEKDPGTERNRLP
jgi:Tfp pilus assembly protein PilN